MRRYRKPHERLDELTDLPVRDNVLPVVLGLIGIGAVVFAMGALGPADGGGAGERLASCLSIADHHARLACYDEIAAQHPPSRGAFAPAQIHREESQ